MAGTQRHARLSAGDSIFPGVAAAFQAAIAILTVTHIHKTWPPAQPVAVFFAYLRSTHFSVPRYFCRYRQTSAGGALA